MSYLDDMDYTDIVTDFLNRKFVVNVETKEEYDSFLHLLCDIDPDIRWKSGARPGYEVSDYFSCYQEDTLIMGCPYKRLEYGGYDFHIEERIICYSEFINSGIPINTKDFISFEEALFGREGG